MDIDSTICEVSGKDKAGASYGYTKKLGYHPLMATRADTGEILHARMRKGAANTGRGAVRFAEELVARVRRAGATGELVMRFDSGFWSNETIAARAPRGPLHHGDPHDQGRDQGDRGNRGGAWAPIAYSCDGEAQVAECEYKGRRLIVRRTRLTVPASRRCGPTGATSGS